MLFIILCRYLYKNVKLWKKSTHDKTYIGYNIGMNINEERF